MTLKDRIGVDVGRKLPVEDAIRWAAGRDVRYIDLQLDIEPNPIESFDDARCEHIAALCADSGVHLGLHTLSAVNIAEVSPLLRDAADRYLEAYIMNAFGSLDDRDRARDYLVERAAEAGVY